MLRKELLDPLESRFFEFYLPNLQGVLFDEHIYCAINHIQGQNCCK